jgi:hypothetical protein
LIKAIFAQAILQSTSKEICRSLLGSYSLKMSDGSYEELLREQFSKVMAICVEAEIEPVEHPKWLEVANELAELLIESPTEQEAKKLLLQHREKIQFFVLAAHTLLQAVARFPLDRRKPGKKPPFYELCELLIQSFSQFDEVSSNSNGPIPNLPPDAYWPHTMEVLVASTEAGKEVGYLDRVLFTRVNGEVPSGEIDPEDADIRWPYPAVWIEGQSSNPHSRRWGAIVETAVSSFPLELEENLRLAYAALVPEDSDASDSEKQDRSSRLEEAVAFGEIARYLQSVKIFGPPSHGGQYWGMIGYPLDSEGRIITSLTVVHIQDEHHSVEIQQAVADIADAIQCWAGWYNLEEIKVPGFRQYETADPPTLRDDEIPPAWSRFFHQRFRRCRPYLNKIEPSYEVRYGAIAISLQEMVTRVASQDWNRELTKFERMARPRSMQAGFYESNHSNCYLSTRAQGNAIISIPDTLVEEFYHTSVDEVCCSDIEWPYEAYYLSFKPPEPLLLAPDFEVDGAYVVRQGNVEAGQEIFLLVTSRNRNIAYHRVPSYICAQDPVFAMHLPIEDVTTTIEDALAKGIAGFYEETEPPKDNISDVVTKPDGTVAVIEDGRFKSRARRREVFVSQREAFDKALRVIVNSMCFLGAYPQDVVSTWDGAPSDLVAKAETDAASRRAEMVADAAKTRLDEIGFVKIKVAGLRTAELLNQPRRTVAGADNQPVRPHWRRGHWRRQKHGERLSLIRLMWIRPVLVNAKLGEAMSGHEYQIDDVKQGN